MIKSIVATKVIDYIKENQRIYDQRSALTNMMFSRMKRPHSSNSPKLINCYLR